MYNLQTVYVYPMTRSYKKKLNQGEINIGGSYIIDTPTMQDLETAHTRYYNEVSTGDLFYRVATELVDLAIHKKTENVSLSDAIAVLLETWNGSYYRFNPKARLLLLSKIETLLENHYRHIDEFRQRTIEEFCDNDVETVKTIFHEFEKDLGRTGAAKCLHLLAPCFFPLWDSAIAKAYKQGKGDGAYQYCSFIEKTRDQVKDLGGKKEFKRNPLKALDEYNFMMITRANR